MYEGQATLLGRYDSCLPGRLSLREFAVLIFPSDSKEYQAELLVQAEQGLTQGKVAIAELQVRCWLLKGMFTDSFERHCQGSPSVLVR